jgi:hypothetical protein
LRSQAPHLCRMGRRGRTDLCRHFCKWLMAMPEPGQGREKEAGMACIEEPRRWGLPAWQDILWLVMAAAGLLLLIFIALAV